MKRLLNLLFLPYKEKKMLGHSLSLIWMIRISLWLFPFKWLDKWLGVLSSNETDNKAVDWIVINNIVRSVKVCSRYVPKATCLTQAVATNTLLRQQGQCSQFKIGVAKNQEEKFEAHAWIEVNGKIIIGKMPRHQRFAVLNSSTLVIL